MKYKVYILDDNVHALELLQTYINRTLDFELVGMSSDPLLFLKLWDQGDIDADIIILDIDMPVITGIELGKYLQGKISLIYTSGYRDYGPEIYELRALDYLLKPFSYTRLLQALELVKSQDKKLSVAPIEYKDPAFIFIPDIGKNALMKITTNEVVFVEAISNASILFLYNGESIQFRQTLKEFEEQMANTTFLRIHKSYIVHIQYIAKVYADYIILDNEKSLPIGESYRKVVRNRLRMM